MKKVVLPAVVLVCIIAGLPAQVDASLRVEPRVVIPVATTLNDGTDKFSVGGGLSIQSELIFPFANWFYAEGVLDAGFLPVNNADQSLLNVSLGFGPGFRYSPAGRLVLKSSIYGGGALLLFDGASALVPFVEPTVDVDFQLSPTLSLGIGGGYRIAFGSGSTVFQAVRVSINLAYSLGAAKSGARLETSPSVNPIYPLYYTYYEEHPTGQVTISNGEKDQITDVQVSFHVPQYMDRPQVTDNVIDRLKSGEEVTIPLYALFSKDIFEVTEGLTVAGEVRVDYTWLGREFTHSEPISVDILNRNAMTWDDDRKAAAFVTANNPLVKSYSKNIAANIRSDEREVYNLNFRIAMGLFEALTLHGTGYVIDAQSAYVDFSEDGAAVDFVQFPAETLAYQAGDCDDLSVLYNAMCEAAAIETAFITIPGHIYTAFNLGIDKDRVTRLFSDTSNLIERDDGFWVPVEITLVEKGFHEAWRIGARQWQEADAKGQADFYPTRQAWGTFKPAEVNTGELVFLPDPDDVMDAYGAAVDRLVYQEISPIVRELQDRMNREGPSPAAYNRIGVAYARFGLLNDAESWFLRSVSGRPYASGEVNLGNVAFLQGDYRNAAVRYRNALDIDDDNPRALLGLAKASFELEDYETADNNMVILAAVNPGMAEHYSYLGTLTDASVARASSAVSKDVYGWDDE